MREQEKALFEMPDSVQQLFFDRIDEVTAQKQRLARPEEDEDYNNAFQPQLQLKGRANA